jgi:hypothetical protein
MCSLLVALLQPHADALLFEEALRLMQLHPEYKPVTSQDQALEQEQAKAYVEVRIRLHALRDRLVDCPADPRPPLESLRILQDAVWRHDAVHRAEHALAPLISAIHDGCSIRWEWKPDEERHPRACYRDRAKAVTLTEDLIRDTDRFV